jgi:hypothetical protein
MPTIRTESNLGTPFGASWDIAGGGWITQLCTSGTTIHPKADGLSSLDLAVQSEGRSAVLPHCPPAVYCPLAAIGVGTGAASERAIVAQLVPAAEIR